MAATGAQAFTAFAEEEAFDLICMDLQMPEMNGFEATALIRSREQGSGKHIPIFAMTAHAMHGDREKCIQSGMDGYISKPIEAAELFRLVEPLVRGFDIQPSVAVTYDRKSLIARTEGDLDLVQEVIDTFIETWPASFKSLEAAVANKDCNALESVSHSMKSAIALFGYRPLVEAALKLETIARAKHLDDAEAILAAIDLQASMLIRTLRGRCLC